MKGRMVTDHSVKGPRRGRPSGESGARHQSPESGAVLGGSPQGSPLGLDPAETSVIIGGESVPLRGPPAAEGHGGRPLRPTPHRVLEPLIRPTKFPADVSSEQSTKAERAARASESRGGRARLLGLCPRPPLPSDAERVLDEVCPDSASRDVPQKVLRGLLLRGQQLPQSLLVLEERIHHPANCPVRCLHEFVLVDEDKEALIGHAAAKRRNVRH
eukprot:CAMPEP_0177605064 /NCGR_PEP_ID=MMETSP0419_2-20121207/16482_1 /TAXON_ID=582737 /ORGANISM="Tetraselmis sp., Strain GSL018" /LENGTH=214 /DNA_ID=CAMNT_0019099149 /DNA_START=300 /DNA_END=943 /DNA_ORIENTATION=-